MDNSEFMVATVEVASLLREYLDQGTDTQANIARRSGLHPRSLYRILRCETLSTTSDVADRVLEAAGLSLSMCPSYSDEGWTSAYQTYMRAKLRANALKRSGKWRHGTPYGYSKKGCRCRECSEAQRRKNSLSNTRRVRTPKPRQRHVHPVLCALRGSAIVF